MDIFNSGGWLKPSLLALLFWGLWGFLTKAGEGKVSWQTLMLMFGACALIAGLLVGSVSFKFNLPHIIGLLAGIAGALGFLFFYLALSKGPATRVIPLTSLYVAVAAVLAIIFLGEDLTIRKALGILSAIAATALLAG
ncbi:EamA family transporter [bacterium]|nr:EamA family transporter [FCB group bacterium]MBL7191541.1 EamA family transporter [bacterium]